MIKTIPEAVKELEQAIQVAIPGFNVTVSINLTTLGPTTAVEPVGEEPVKEEPTTEEPSKELTLDDIRTLLNAYAKAAGKEKAVALVGKFANGSRNPADIKPEDYRALVAGMGGYDLNPKGDK